MDKQTITFSSDVGDTYDNIFYRTEIGPLIDPNTFIRIYFTRLVKKKLLMKTFPSNHC